MPVEATAPGAGRRRLPTGANLVRAVAGPALVVLVLVAVGACAESYPGEVTAPELVGLVTSSTTDQDLTAHIVLADGTELVIPRSDRVLGGFGELLMGGTKPEQWYLGGHASEKPDCYSISAHKAYSEDGAVVLAFEEWPGVGLRLPKAPGYDDSKLVTADSSGRLAYSAIGPVSLCVDEQGPRQWARMTGWEKRRTR